MGNMSETHAGEEEEEDRGEMSFTPKDIITGCLCCAVAAAAAFFAVGGAVARPPWGDLTLKPTCMRQSAVVNTPADQSTDMLVNWRNQLIPNNTSATTRVGKTIKFIFPTYVPTLSTTFSTKPNAFTFSPFARQNERDCAEFIFSIFNCKRRAMEALKRHTEEPESRKTFVGRALHILFPLTFPSTPTLSSQPPIKPSKINTER